MTSIATAQIRIEPTGLFDQRPHPQGGNVKHCKAFQARIEIAQSAKTDDGSELTSAEIYIYDPIGESIWQDTTSAKSLAKQIAALDVDELHVYINSPGGDAWDGLAIMNALRRHRAHVTITVDALAASAASVIAMAADHLVMNRGAELMIHDPWTWTDGNAEDLRKVADTLDKLADSYAAAYAARAGGAAGEWRELMRAESWFTAEEAVTAGLADEAVDAPAAAAHFDLSGFRYQGRAQAPAPHRLLPASEPEETTVSTMKENLMSTMLTEGLCQRLGIADSTADEEAILAALDERLAAPAAGEFTAASIPEGMALVDEAILTQMRADAEKAREALAAAEAARRDAIVDEAVKSGRLAPASRERMRALLDADEESASALIESLAPNTIPVAEVGFSDAESMSDAEMVARMAWGAESDSEKKEA